MRKGQNPAKFVKDVPRPQRITVALLNSIPFLSGFYAETLDVLKVCMESIERTRACRLIWWSLITARAPKCATF